MKSTVKYFLVLLFCLPALFLKAQLYGNEWIVPNQVYFKMLTYQNGIYAVTGQELVSAGVPLSAWDVNKIQLWHRGKEQAILISGIDDGVFDLTDSLIFYGQRNDGTLDSLLYTPHSEQVDPYINLYSDTCTFFLTQGASSGKRISKPSVNPFAYPTAHLNAVLSVYADAYEGGEIYAESRLSYFGKGEGWTGESVAINANAPPAIKTFVFPVSNYNASGPAPYVELSLLGTNESTHKVHILIGDPAFPYYAAVVPGFVGYEHKEIKIPLYNTFFPGSSLSISLQVEGSSGLPDRVAVSYINLVYPQDLLTSTGAKVFNFLPDGVDKEVTIQGGAVLSHAYDLTNPDNIRALYITGLAGGVKVKIPGNAAKVFLVADSLIKKPFAIRKAEMTSCLPSTAGVNEASFIIITHPKFLTSARDYATYRASGEGGAYDTLVAQTQAIYDQYSYGEFTPLGIKNFCRSLVDHGDPKYLLLIGKGLDVNYNHYFPGGWYRFNPQAYTSQINTEEYVENFVPYGGNPSSDLVYVSGIGGNPELVPAFPVGRINAKKEEDVYAYLDKVKTHEALGEDQLWRKNILHLSGGKTDPQILDFKSRLEHLKPIVEDTVFGGKVVKHIVKNTGTNVDNQLIESVAEQVNKGLSYITFMGHGSPSVPDVDIGFVSNDLYGYHNYGKYPMLFLNGCEFVNGLVPTSLAEDWILTPGKGALLTLSHSDFGYAYFLEKYTKSFYKHAFTERKTFTDNLSVGDLQKLVIEELRSDPSIYMKAMLQQMLLQGDPAVRMYSPSKPDFAVTGAFITSFTGFPVTASSDSFQVGVVVKNFGITSPDSLLISLTRKVGTETMQYESYFYPAVKNIDTLYLKIKKKAEEKFSGINYFMVNADPMNAIPELNKINNSFSFDYFFSYSFPNALLPAAFSIVHKQPVNFIAQPTGSVLQEKAYYIELDTSALFNSSFKKSAIINASGLIKWNNVSLLPDEASNDSVVYYWRVRFNEIAVEEDTIWGTSSFIYIRDSPEGWSQSTMAQLKKDKFEGLDVLNNKLTYKTIQSTLYAVTPGKQYAVPDASKATTYYAGLAVNGSGIIYDGRGLCDEGILALVLDKSTLNAYSPIPMYQCGYSYGANVPVQVFKYIQYTGGYMSSQVDLITYLDSVKTGDYVLLMSFGDIYYQNWSSALKDKIKAVLGAKYVDSLQAQSPYIILGKKGSSPISEAYGKPTDIISLSETITGKYNSGTITSVPIGPAEKWGTLFKTFTQTSGDAYNLKVVGFSPTGIPDTLLSNVNQDSANLSFIDAKKYPNIKLVLSASDPVNLSPLELNRWQVIYNAPPEGTIDPVAAGAGQYDYFVKQEGDSVNLHFVFQNISTKDFVDTLAVQFYLSNESGKKWIDTVSLSPLAKDTSLSFNYKMSTVGWGGDNVLQAFVNPVLLPELYYSNNVQNVKFHVISDKTNPVLDVTFDGQHIMDGDIVSPNPYIVISLKDENKFMLKNDTLGMKLYHKNPCVGCGFELVPLSSPAILSWGQASGKGNDFRIEYNPKGLKDGIHTLRVQGSDVSGNPSGSKPYEINFEVINASTISNFYPYPNPFSTSTRFVFTLTGSKIPDDIIIQIMTVTGKVVREITKDQLGPIHIGNNITSYAWDGRDDFGDQLANGVYLYQVKIKGADAFEHRATFGDKAFKKNFGKMYLLR